uniref:sigma 54-interacting transcriptional regulator n=1 Tax=Peribacillus sp. FSL E2-0159 TaxID=2975289 RepID=UPI00406CE4C5
MTACKYSCDKATHRNLEEMVQNGTFRKDLYYRINVIPLYTKLLKERRDDIPFFL